MDDQDGTFLLHIGVMLSFHTSDKDFVVKFIQLIVKQFQPGTQFRFFRCICTMYNVYLGFITILHYESQLLQGQRQAVINH